MNDGATKSLKLPFLFDEGKLLSDLEATLGREWTPHFNQEDYEGDWNIIALMAKGGKETNIYAFHAGAGPMMGTAALQKCNYIPEVLDSFKFPILSARLMRLKSGAVIKPHEDSSLGYDDGCFRLHIPITTNPRVEFVLAGERLIMQPGECWYTNVNYTHSVSNLGTSDRVHLVIDGERNAWSDDLFFSLAPEQSFRTVRPKKNFSREAKLAMMKVLKGREEEAAKRLFAEFARDLRESED